MVYSTKEDGSDIKILATQTVIDPNNNLGIFKPSWSLDGKTILYNTDDLGQNLLNLVTPDGTFNTNIRYIGGSADWIDVE